DNPDWGAADRRPDMNHFMARLIFRFFAEDTGIFPPNLFTKTVSELTDASSANTHSVIAELFRAMDIQREKRGPAKLKAWADKFPYVNGGLFTGTTDCPRFSRIARAYLLRAGELNWREINPDIFGSMIQAVEDEGERGSLGMHYTSVPNILKVLNPLFLDDLRQQLEAAGDNVRKLRNLRRRIAAIRVFDPACGSGNFLVVAYQQMREIEAEIIRRLREDGASWIKLENFYGIEIKSFPVEIAKLSLLIAEFQCDVRYRGERLACLNVLPLHRTGQIHVGNALRLSWLEVCPPASNALAEQWDLGGPTGRLALEENNLEKTVEIETYVCGNPPYVGGKKQNSQQKQDIKLVFGQEEKYKNLDYICGFILKACEFLQFATKSAFVTTNSIVQGTHVPVLWPIVYRHGCQIQFAYETFKWANNAQHNAGVSCTIFGITKNEIVSKFIYNESSRRKVVNINAYLIDGQNVIVGSQSKNSNLLSTMITGNAAYDGGHLFLSADEARKLVEREPTTKKLLRKVSGTSEFVDGIARYCLWLDDSDLALVDKVPEIVMRIGKVLEYRKGGGEVACTLTDRPHQFRYRNSSRFAQILVPQVSSERREHLPVGFLKSDIVITHLAHAIYDPTLVDFSVLVSKLHLVWITTICGKLETRIRYSSNLGWNTFPLPQLTEKNKANLTRCAEDILLARENHFPKTIAELYDPEEMPDDLRRAHEANDETLERIYIGRRFKNDTERLEKLFELYAKMAPPQADKEPKAKTSTKTTRKTKAVS
ncbi:lactate dehydrogenase, partial [Methylosinus sp. R-45379]|uniref:class I SAM-dependent DNA methyltransferase n=1 Tax=Methylosinus sp. R-45379 TaxID=980563 RepID=UPI0007C90308